MAKSKVIYWHRLGLKIYEVEGANVSLVRDIETTNEDEIEDRLSFLKDEVVYLLLSDAVSYLFETEFDAGEVVDAGFRERLLPKIKGDIPEDFSEFSWDYKIVEEEGNKKVLVFAPIAEVQLKINQLSKDLEIKFEVIEPESVAADRDPNPILGIIKKNDVVGKDEEVLNIVIDQKPKKINKYLKILLVILGLVIFVLVNYFLYKKYFGQKIVVKKAEVVVPTVVATPTVAGVTWEQLKIVVQNGTSVPGKAGRVVDQLKSMGVVEVSGGNADNKNYLENKVYFRNENIKNIAKEKLLTVVSVGETNMLVDNTMENDVKLILGIN